MRKKAKAGEDYYEYNGEYDDIELILGAARFAERTDGLRGHLSAFKKQTDLMYSVSALEDKKKQLTDKLNGQKEDLEKRLAVNKGEYDSLMYQYQNGTIDSVEADKKMSRLEDEQDYISEQLQNLQEDYDFEVEGIDLDLQDARSASGVRDKIADNFEKVISKIEAYKSMDPAMFVMLAERIDFNGIYDTLTGRLDDNETAAVYGKVETVIRETEEDLARQRKSSKRFDRINQKTRDRRREEERVLREQEEERRARMRSGRTSLSEGGKAQSSEEEAKERMARRMARRAGTNVNPNGDGEGVPNAGGLRNEDK